MVSTLVRWVKPITLPALYHVMFKSLGPPITKQNNTILSLTLTLELDAVTVTF